MSPKDWFGVVVRGFGLYFFRESLLFAYGVFRNSQRGLSVSDPATRLQMLAAVAFFLLAAYCVSGASHLVRYCYQEPGTGNGQDAGTAYDRSKNANAVGIVPFFGIVVRGFGLYFLTQGLYLLYTTLGYCCGPLVFGLLTVALYLAIGIYFLLGAPQLVRFCYAFSAEDGRRPTEVQ